MCLLVHKKNLETRNIVQDIEKRYFVRNLLIIYQKNILSKKGYFQLKLKGVESNPSRQSHDRSNNRNTRTKFEICSKLTVKPSKRRKWFRFGRFIVNFEHISHLCSSVSIINFEQVNASWYH